MATDVTLCNRAIQKVGGQPLSTLADDTEAARACNRIYSDIILSELRANNWNCVIKRAIVSCDKTITTVSTAADPVFTTSAAHGFSVDDYIYIEGLDWDEAGDPIPNGVYRVSAIPLTTTFTITDDGAAISTVGYTWTTSATGTTNLSAAWGFTASFAIPSDCLRVIELNNYSGLHEILGASGKGYADFSIESNRILTNSNDDLEIRYVCTIPVTAGTTITPVLDYLLQEAICLKIGIEICEILTEDQGKKNQLWQEYKIAITQAKRCDAIETPGYALDEDDWLNARL